jgi:betaine-aldehyde dehydrogenase
LKESLQTYIAGTWVVGKGPERVLRNPATGEVITKVLESSHEQVDFAVRSAKNAFLHSEWAHDVSTRVHVLRRMAELLEISADEFARLETKNTGKPLRESQLDVADSITCLRYYADFIESKQPWTKEMFDGTNSTITEEPIGVCALIVPWNFPLLLGIWKLAPALAAGNTVVLKPSELTPLTMLKLGVLADESGIPGGVFNIVLGDGAVGQALVSHPDVDKVSFTGGTESGTRVYMECAKSLKRVSLELGGKSPLIVFDDVDVDIAVDLALFGAFYNQGQVCVASSRLLVQESIYEPFLERLAQRMADVHIGNPLNEETELGPLISEQHLDKVLNYIHIGIEEGATLFCGGERLHALGELYVSPAVFINVRQDMRIVQEEIFGPVVTVQSFSSEEEAVDLANGTVYGLAAGVLSADIHRAERVAKNIRAGTVWINGYHTPHVDTAWGGFKRSGIGRELGIYGLAAFSEVKHTNLNRTVAKVGWFRDTQRV